ncbi:MAG: mannitol dehydrogenase family protein [Xylophilus ampelinus]
MTHGDAPPPIRDGLPAAAAPPSSAAPAGAAQQRLRPDTLDRLPGDVARPRYPRAGLRAGIVHLGLGAFHRGHLAAVNEAALAAGDRRWGIVGVSLRSPDARDALGPQDGLYALALRDIDPADGLPRETLQVIGGLVGLLVAPEDPGAVLDRIAHPDTRIVSLTVTEKGYHHDPATRALRTDDPDVVHDLARPDAPRGTLGFLAHGLARRRARGLGPVTLLSCDNLPSNGDTLRGLLRSFAERVDPALAAWIDAGCRFPNSMVDRIVPRATDADRDRIAARLGLRDAAPVVGEPFLAWVVEDRFAAGRPDWDAVPGVRFVEDAAPWERLKLRLVNAPHSALAYLGAAMGAATIAEAVAVPALRRYAEALLREELAPTLGPLPGFAPDAFCAGVLARFANPALGHTTRQVAMDGSQKIPQRWLAALRERLEAGAPFDRLALALAGWAHYLRGGDAGATAAGPVQDPLAEALLRRLTDGAPGGGAPPAGTAAGEAAPADRSAGRIAALLDFAPVFGDLGGRPDLAAAVARWHRALAADGVRATLERLP